MDNEASYERLRLTEPFPGNPTSAYLNDNLVNGYFNVLQVAEMEGEIASAYPSGIFSGQYRVYFASSFLLTKLIFVPRPDNEVDNLYSLRVLRPYNLDNILDVRFIVLPACHCMHWTLFVVDFENRLVHYYNSLLSDRVKAEDYCTRVITWLRRLHKQYNRPWRGDFKARVYKYIPQQHNTWDCGVFVLAYANHLAFKGFPMSKDSFGQRDIPSFRQQLLRQLKLREVAPLKVRTS